MPQRAFLRFISKCIAMSLAVAVGVDAWLFNPEGIPDLLTSSRDEYPLPGTSDAARFLTAAATQDGGGGGEMTLQQVLDHLDALEQRGLSLEATLGQIEENQTNFAEELKWLRETAAPDSPTEVRLLKPSSISERLEYLEAMTKDKIPATCDHVRKHGAEFPGRYQIDPDGHAGDHEPVEVYCDSNDNEGLTFVHHDDDREGVHMEPCDEPGCVTVGRLLNYEIPHGQISSLLKMSRDCSQELKLHIPDEMIPRDPLNPYVAVTWEDTSGRGHQTMALPRVRAKGRPVTPEAEASRDASLAGSIQIIRLNSRDHILPVARFTLHGLGRDGDAKYDVGSDEATTKGPSHGGSSRVKREVGPLICRGKRSMAEGDWSGCDALYDAGVRHSGFHWLNHGNYVYQQTYCDMRQGTRKRSTGATTGPRMGGRPVHFHVFRTKPFNFRSKIVTYDSFLTNTGGGMDNNTGIFTAPVAGIYHFHFQFLQATHFTSRGAEFYLVREDVAVNGAISSGYPRSVGVTTAVLKLRADDRVYVRLFHGGGFSNKHGYIFFSGSLMDPA